MTRQTPRPRARPRLLTALAALAVALTAAPTAASAQGADDPALDQTLDDLSVVRGERVLDIGHVDMGPKFVDGEWTLLIHDDAARDDAGATSVWRYPDETVLHVLDQGELTVPDDPAYEFIGASPGEPVWVIPQTQNPEVVWLGWNTQDPEVMTSIDRGVTLTLTGVQGPGVVTVYLQSGAFGDPQVLWDSRVPDPQSAWVDVNTHTHANWVFTEPGVYLLRLQVDAELVDGSSVSDTQRIRVAVGTSTDPGSALAAAWDGPAQAADDAGAGGDTDAADADPADPGSTTDSLSPILIGAVILVAGLIAAATIMIVRSGRARRRVLDSRAAAPAAGGDGADGRDER